MSWTITTTDYNTYTWFGYWDGSSTVDVIFSNYNQTGGEETDLFVDWMEVNGVRTEAKKRV